LHSFNNFHIIKNYVIPYYNVFAWPQQLLLFRRFSLKSFFANLQEVLHEPCSIIGLCILLRVYQST
jgi:hypothetical protein